MAKQLQKIPSLRFLDKNGDKFPEWIVLSLSDFGKASMCKRIFKDETSEVGDIPFFKIGTFGKKPDAFISREKYEEYKEKYSFPKVGEILLSASGTIGRQVVYDGKPAYFQDSNIIWLEHDESKITNSFLGHIYANINWKTDANTIERLYNKNFLNTKVVVPCIDEQQKIASFLSSADNWIESLEKQKLSLEEYKKGMIREIFSQKIRFKDDKGNEYPRWEEKQLKDLATITTGSSNKVDSHFSGDYAFFDRSGDVLFSDKYLFEGEAIIVAGEGSNFHPKYFSGKFDLHQRAYAIYKFKNGDSKYIYYYIQTMNNYFLSKAVGSTVKSLRLPTFKDMPVLLPDMREQKKISNYLSLLDKLVESKINQIKNAKKWKKGLLQQMFV